MTIYIMTAIAACAYCAAYSIHSLKIEKQRPALGGALLIILLCAAAVTAAL